MQDWFGRHTAEVESVLRQQHTRGLVDHELLPEHRPASHGTKSMSVGAGQQHDRDRSQVDRYDGRTCCFLVLKYWDPAVDLQPHHHVRQIRACWKLRGGSARCHLASWRHAETGKHAGLSRRCRKNLEERMSGSVEHATAERSSEESHGAGSCPRPMIWTRDHKWSHL